MKCKENCTTTYSEEKGQTASVLLPDMQALKRDLITRHHFILH